MKNYLSEELSNMKAKLKILEEKQRKYRNVVLLSSSLTIGVVFGIQSKCNHNPLTLDSEYAYQMEYLIDDNGDISYVKGNIADEYQKLGDFPQIITYKTGWTEINDQNGKYVRNVKEYTFQKQSYEELKKLVLNPYFLTHYNESQKVEPEYSNEVDELNQEECIIKMPYHLIVIKRKQSNFENLMDIALLIALSGIWINFCKEAAKICLYEDKTEFKKDVQKIKAYRKNIEYMKCEKLVEEQKMVLNRKNKNQPEC